MKASDLFVRCLEAEGVEYVFGIPGEENLDLLESLRQSSIQLLLTRNEQSAVFMAATYGRFAGKPGVALATLGPGATNMMTGVGYAQLNGMPVVAITGQKPIKKSKQGQFQVIDVVSMMEPVTKWSAQIKNGARVTTSVRQAFKLAIEERPGATHLELPEDIAREEVEGYEPMPPRKVRRPLVEDKAYAQLKEWLEAARRPVVLVGAGANRKQVTKHLARLVESANLPFFESQMGKGVLDERLPQYIGTAALSEGDGVHRAVEMADLILAVGHDTIEKPTNFTCPGETRTVHLNYYSAQVDDVYAPELEIVGDLGNLFWRLCEDRLDTSRWDHGPLFAVAREERQKLEAAVEKEADSPVMGPRRLARELRQALGENDILALDNGWYKVWLARNYPAYRPNTLLLDNTFATMGAGLSSGAAAAFLNPDRKVAVVTGDGGLMMNLGDLETAVRLGVSLAVVIANDRAYGMIKIKQAQAGFESYGLDLTNPDFERLAESFGARGLRVESPDAFYPALQEALSHKGVTLIDLPFAYPPDVS